jgi:hypothetical protein
MPFTYTTLQRHETPDSPDLDAGIGGECGLSIGQRSTAWVQNHPREVRRIASNPHQLLNRRHQIADGERLNQDRPMGGIHKFRAFAVSRDVDHRDAWVMGLGMQAERCARWRTGTEMQPGDEKIGWCRASEAAPSSHPIIGNDDIVSCLLERQLYLSKKLQVGFSNENAHVNGPRLGTVAMERRAGTLMRLSTLEESRGRNRSR